LISFLKYNDSGDFIPMDNHSQEAFTGLEAAIVLIAFVVVAAVFSYVVLGAGFFTTQKAQETIYKSVEQSTTNLLLIGNVYGLSSTPTSGIDEIKLSIGLAPGAPTIDLSKLKVVFSTPNTTPIILSVGSTATQTTFTAKESGAGSSFSSMSQNQQIEINFLVSPVPVNTRINIEIRPGVGAALPFSKTTPATITTTNILS
jgi:flagellin FlaB